eukprot:Amastigsp_a347217_13.p3 type:complete len:103 gc:universal Amastigsp_a347217_13:187-495(+)
MTIRPTSKCSDAMSTKTCAKSLQQWCWSTSMSWSQSVVLSPARQRLRVVAVHVQYTTKNPEAMTPLINVTASTTARTGTRTALAAGTLTTATPTTHAARAIA